NGQEKIPTVAGKRRHSSDRHRQRYAMKFHSSSTWRELDAWANKLGVSPMATIRAATYWPAVMMKVDKDYGSISEGKFADIIAVKGDVLRYIDLLQRVDLIIKHGKRYK